MSESGLEPQSATKRALSRSLFGLAALGAAAYGCASQSGVTRLADGSYRVECEQPLLNCLEPAAKLCELHGYEIYEASEARDRYGPSPWQAGSVKSSALVRCRTAAPAGLFGAVHSLPNPPPSASAPRPAASAAPAPVAPAPVAAPPGCVPGTSLSCATTAGCSGAQVCGADGRSFGPCECAPAASPPAAPPPAAPPR